MSVIIREYRDADYDACVALYGELSQHYAEIYGDPAIAEGDSAKWLDSLRKRHEYYGTWVAEYDGRVIGLAGLLADGETGEIEPIIVSAPYRNNGTGTMLVRHVTEEAKKKEVRFLSIKPHARNEDAISLYVRLGFEKLGLVELFKDLQPEKGRSWKLGIDIHGNKLSY